jgi:uncharacterized protein YuzE
MPGLDPGIHAEHARDKLCSSCPNRTMDCRIKSGNDVKKNQAMRVRVDQAADAVYLNLTDRPIKDSAEVADGIVVDYDDEGRIVGVEILDASKRTGDPEVLEQFGFELPTGA